MINYDFLTLKAFFVENIDFLIGARIQKIQQPTRRELIFSLRNCGESKKLYINILPQMYHMCFISSENEKKRNIKMPKQPPMFCMLLRKYIEGCKISDAKVIENERIFELYFETMDEFSQKRSLCLAVELMGKHSNVILYDRETMLIIGCAHNVGSEKSRYRELQGGLKYIYPPKSEIKLSKELEKQFCGLPEKKVRYYLASEVYTPAVLDDRYTLFQELIPNSVLKESVNSMLDDYYAEVQQRGLVKSEQARLRTIVKPKLQKVKNSVEKISALLKKRDKTDTYKLYGELITANLYLKADYQNEIELFDYVNNENIKIELDPAKTFSENAQRYFKLYTKSKTTKQKSLELLGGLKIEKEYLEAILYSIDRAENYLELEEIASEIDTNKPKAKEADKNPILQMKLGGFDVFIGRNNKQNDYIVSKLAKDDDIWFHTRLCAGSHVLLKTRGIEPDEDVLFECCKLAREYSSAELPSKVGVIYTKAKYLKKPPASPLGYVTYRNEKEVLV